VIPVGFIEKNRKTGLNQNNVVDFVAVKAQAIHKDQQDRNRSAVRIHSKALRIHKFQ
jgi:hypothetical protein